MLYPEHFNLIWRSWNVMYFRKRSEQTLYHIEGYNETLKILMDILFNNGDYVFKFKEPPPFEIVAEIEG